MIYLKCVNPIMGLETNRLYKVSEENSDFHTYYGFMMERFKPLSQVEVLIECHKRGITVADIKELK